MHITKLGILRSIGHNIADSLGSGVGLMIGVYEMDVFGEAKKCPGGRLTVDFLSGKPIQGRVSRSLQLAISKYRDALSALCVKQGASMNDFRTLTASYSGDVFNPRIAVTVRDSIGRCYMDEYIGIPARHVKVTDKLGRIRTRRGRRVIFRAV